MASDTEANFCAARGKYPCNSADPNICEPCQKLYELEDECRKLKEQANYTHDHLIHRLPLDVAGYIFELCIPEGVADLDLSKEMSRYKLCAPFILSAVCRRWRTVAFSTLQLWTTIPLSNDRLDFPRPLILKEWISRTGQLPLSINLSVEYGYAPTDDQETIIILKNILDVLNQYSDRWLKIKYKGPFSLLSRLLNDEQFLPQLRTLSLLSSLNCYRHDSALKLHPMQLNKLSISRIKFASITFDLDHLTELYMDEPHLSECFEALRRAPCLTQCSFDSPGSDTATFPLPPHPIVHCKLQSLKIDGGHDKICQCLSCPSLKSLALESRYACVPEIVEFLGRSGCSLETLSLEDCNMSVSGIGLLLQAIPSLRHLHMKLDLSGSTPKYLFAHLAEFSIVDGKKVPRYLPALSSLVMDMKTFDGWEMIPDIFGPPGPTAHSTDHHRHALVDVKIFVSHASRMSSISGYDFSAEVARRIVWLRDAGVKLEVQFDDEIDRYDISTLGEVERP